MTSLKWIPNIMGVLPPVFLWWHTCTKASWPSEHISKGRIASFDADGFLDFNGWSYFLNVLYLSSFLKLSVFHFKVYESRKFLKKFRECVWLVKSSRCCGASIFTEQFNRGATHVNSTMQEYISTTLSKKYLQQLYGLEIFCCHFPYAKSFGTKSRQHWQSWFFELSPTTWIRLGCRT